MIRNVVEPHHDGSSLYVSNDAPELGDIVNFRVRVPKGDKSKNIYIRIIEDGEARIFPLKRKSSNQFETWWSVNVAILNPTTNYRFLLKNGKEFRWLNAFGVIAGDVTDHHDFRIICKTKTPQWIKSAIFYQIFPDRFANSGKIKKLPDWAVPRAWNSLPQGRGKYTGQEFFGGDFEGVESKIDYLKELGVNAIYFTPFFPSRSNHRYDATSFDHADPLLGGDEALISLSRTAARNEIKIMGDLTTNHCGAGHPWLKERREYFYWDSKIPHGYVGWWGLASLPKLNFGSSALHREMYSGANSIVKKWLREPFSMAGWRIDVGNMTGRLGADDFNRDVAKGIRKAMEEISPETWLVAENADQAAEDLDGFGWHGTMNYNGFTKPIWHWINAPKGKKKIEDSLGMPGELGKITGLAMVNGLRSFAAGIPWRSLTASMILLDSHDRARFHTVVGGDIHRHLVGATLLFTYPGVPSVFAGDEIGIEGSWGEDARRTINWDDRSKWNIRLLEQYKKLINIRRNSSALIEGGLRWIYLDETAVGYLRESAKESILVLVTSGKSKVNLDLSKYGYQIRDTLHGPSLKGKKITFSTKGPTSGIWLLK